MPRPSERSITLCIRALTGPKLLPHRHLEVKRRKIAEFQRGTVDLDVDVEPTEEFGLLSPLFTGRLPDARTSVVLDGEPQFAPTFRVHDVERRRVAPLRVLREGQQHQLKGIRDVLPNFVRRVVVTSDGDGHRIHPPHQFEQLRQVSRFRHLHVQSGSSNSPNSIFIWPYYFIIFYTNFQVITASNSDISMLY